MKGLSLFTALFFFLTLAFSAPLPNAVPGNFNWAQWRGPDSQGISTEKNLPTEWSDTKNVLWKTTIPGLGFSQPIIWGKKVFLTTAIEGNAAPTEHKAPKHMLGAEEYKHPDWYGSDKLHTFKVLCLDRDAGKILWEQTVYSGPVYDHRHRRGTYAGPTSVTDGKYLISYFGSEGVYCHDFNGKLLWKNKIGDIDTFGMGVGSSPVLFENLVIFVADQNLGTPKGSFLLALDKRTGKQVWRVERPIQGSWFTPVLVKTNGRTELVTSGNEFLMSYDPATGKELWRTTGLKSHAIATPVVKGDIAVLSSGFPSKKIIAVKLGGAGLLDGTKNILWTYNKGTSYVPSPILYDNYLYLMSDAGVLTCVEPETGKIVYEGGRVPVATKFYGASPVAFDGKLLLTSDDGDTFVIKAGPQHEVLRTNSIGEPCRTSIAIADGKLFIRGEKHLFCIANNAKLAKN